MAFFLKRGVSSVRWAVISRIDTDNGQQRVQDIAMSPVFWDITPAAACSMLASSLA
jgi:hypothetical protein